jgi:epoxyqueuosine reductase
MNQHQTSDVERPDDIKAAIQAEAHELGFAVVGFAAAGALAGRGVGTDLAQFLGEGRHGDMAWLARHAERRADPKTLWPEVKSVISLGMSYAPADDPLKLTRLPDHASISVYARGRDYHDVMKSRLKRLARWLVGRSEADVKVFVDTAPVMEKPLAQAAGVGWQGRHTNLVSRSAGSWLFLGEIFTTLDLVPDQVHADRCGSCRACIDACPTQALSDDGRIDARACISYLTIEHAGDIAPALMADMGNRVYGCDDCLSVCPWNKFAAPTAEAAFQPRIELSAPRLADFAQLDDAAFRQVFSGSPIKRTGRDRFVRNVLIAIGNSGLAELGKYAAQSLSDDSDIVRRAAAWAQTRLKNSARLKKKTPAKNAGAK